MAVVVIVTALVAVVVTGIAAGWLHQGNRDGNELRGSVTPMRHGGNVVATGHLVEVAHAALVRPGRHRA